MRVITIKRLKERKIEKISLMHQGRNFYINYTQDDKYRVHDSFCSTDDFFEPIEKIGLSDEKILEILQHFMEMQSYDHKYYCKPYVTAVLENINARSTLKLIERHKRGGRQAFVMRKLRSDKPIN